MTTPVPSDSAIDTRTHEPEGTERSGKIGFFDSGVGGFTILSAVRGKLPEYDYVYFGDTAHIPYGDRTEDEVYALTLEGVKALFAHGASIVILACNTASAQTLRKLQDSLIPHVYADKRILGVIIPTIETIIASGKKRVLLIATRRTVDSKKYDLELMLKNAPADVVLTSVATPKLVPFLERGQLADAMAYLDEVIGPRAGKTDLLVLGCTHYVLLKRLIREQYPHLTVISQDEVIPAKLEDYLLRHAEFQCELGTHGSLEVILTEDSLEYRNRMLNLFVS
jgi:glutamate racemase